MREKASPLARADQICLKMELATQIVYASFWKA